MSSLRHSEQSKAALPAACRNSLAWRPAIGVALLAMTSFAAVAGSTDSNPETVCRYDPAMGQPNPLGMRSFVELQSHGADTRAVYVQLPSPVAPVNDNSSPVTIASERELVFHNKSIAEARQLLLDSSALYAELLGYPDDEGFARVNAVLKCTPR